MNNPIITTIGIVVFALGIPTERAQGLTKFSHPPSVLGHSPAIPSDSLQRMLQTQTDRVDRILASIEERRTSRDEILTDMREHLGFLGALAPRLIRMNDLLSEKEKTPADWKDLVSLMDSAATAIEATRPAWEPNAVRLENEVTRLQDVWGNVVSYAHEIVADAVSRLQTAQASVIHSANQLQELSQKGEQTSPGCQLIENPASCPLDVRRRAMDLEEAQHEAQDEAQVIEHLLPGLREGAHQIELILPRLQEQELQLVRARHQLARVQNRLQVMIRETRPVLNFNSIIENYSGLEEEVARFTAAFAELAEEFDALPAVTFTLTSAGDDLYSTAERQARSIRASIAYADSLRRDLDGVHATTTGSDREGSGR